MKVRDLIKFTYLNTYTTETKIYDLADSGIYEEYLGRLDFVLDRDIGVLDLRIVNEEGIATVFLRPQCQIKIDKEVYYAM